MSSTTKTKNTGKPKIYESLSSSEKLRMDEILNITEEDLHTAKTDMDKSFVASQLRRKRLLAQMDSMKYGFPVAHKTRAKNYIVHDVFSQDFFQSPQDSAVWDEARDKLQNFVRYGYKLMDVVDAWLIFKLSEENLLSATDLMGVRKQKFFVNYKVLDKVFDELLPVSATDEELKKVSLRICSNNNYIHAMNYVHAMLKDDYEAKLLNNSKIFTVLLGQDFDFSNSFMVDLVLSQILDIYNDMTKHKMSGKYTMKQVMNMAIYDIVALLKKDERNVVLMEKYAQEHGVVVKDLAGIMQRGMFAKDGSFVDFLWMLKAQFYAEKNKTFMNLYEWIEEDQKVVMKEL